MRMTGGLSTGCFVISFLFDPNHTEGLLPSTVSLKVPNPGISVTNSINLQTNTITQLKNP